MVGTESAAPWDDCCAACRDASDCDGFAASGVNCWLKTGPLTLVNEGTNTGVSAYYSGSISNSGGASNANSGACAAGGWTVYEDTDVQGNGGLDYVYSSGTQSANPHEDCCAQCTADPTCTGFAAVGTTCYMKTGTLTLQAVGGNVGTTGYFVDTSGSLATGTNCAAGGWTVYVDTDIQGVGGQVVTGAQSAVPYEDCCAAGGSVTRPTFPIRLSRSSGRLSRCLTIAS